MKVEKPHKSQDSYEKNGNNLMFIAKKSKKSIKYHGRKQYHD